MIVGGAAVAVFTFLPWYDVAGVDRNAWEGLRRTDVLIFAAGLIAGLAGAWIAFGDPGPERPVVAAVAAAAAAAAALVVVVRMFSPPGDAGLKFGIFIALAAAVVAAVASLLAFTAGAPAKRPETTARD
jgi:hypothetical protein